MPYSAELVVQDHFVSHNIAGISGITGFRCNLNTIAARVINLVTNNTAVLIPDITRFQEQPSTVTSQLL